MSQHNVPKKRSANSRAASIGYFRLSLSALALCATTIPAVAAVASCDEPPSPPSVAATSLLARMFPLTQTADWVSVSYYVTSQSYNDIEVEALDVGRAWRLGSRLEVQGRLGLFHSEGERFDAPWLTDENSRTSGITFGGDARLYALQGRTLRLFVEGAAEIVYTPGSEQIPAGGTGINAFLRLGGGLQYQITPHLALEAHYEYAHVSNGAGSVEQNPMWNGRGGGLTVRRSL